MKRRDFLRHSLAAGGAIALGQRAQAAPSAAFGAPEPTMSFISAPRK